jgi:hypothetical protein
MSGPWDTVLPLAFVLAALGLALSSVYFRARAMRALAVRWDLRFLGSKFPGGKFPMDRRRFRFPANHFKKVSNVLSGSCNGKEVLVFDAVVGTGKGVYATFFLVRSEDDPFGGKPEPWTLVHSNGWCALWCIRFWQIPWTMSARMIEEQLRKL